MIMMREPNAFDSFLSENLAIRKPLDPQFVA